MDNFRNLVYFCNYVHLKSFLWKRDFPISSKLQTSRIWFHELHWICYWQIGFCTYYVFSLNQMSDIGEVWKYWPLKDGFHLILQKLYWLPFCGGWTKMLPTFSRHFVWEQPSKYCIAEFTAIFVCLLLSWSRRYSMNWSSNFDGP